MYIEFQPLISDFSNIKNNRRIQELGAGVRFNKAPSVTL